VDLAHALQGEMLASRRKNAGDREGQPPRAAERNVSSKGRRRRRPRFAAFAGVVHAEAVALHDIELGAGAERNGRGIGARGER
jgi:hypothetical protein